MKDKPTAIKSHNGHNNHSIGTEYQELLKKYDAVNKRKEKIAHYNCIRQCVLFYLFLDWLSDKLMIEGAKPKIPHILSELFKNRNDFKKALRIYQDNKYKGVSCNGYTLSIIDNKVMLQLDLKEIDASK